MNKIIVSFLIALVIGFNFLPSSNKLISSKPNHHNQEKAKSDQPDKAAQWLAQLRQTPNDSVSPAQLNKSIKTHVQKRELVRSSQKSAVELNIPKFTFENLGPSNFGGRIRGFVIHNEDTDKLLIGSVLGGVFKSENAGKSWHSQSDFIPTLAIGSLLADPDNSNRVYAGTGEGFFNSDAARGAGIFISEDFGETWNQLASTDNEDFYYVNRMARIANSNILIAATRKGIFRSNDLGQSWSEASQYDTNGRGFVDMKIDPSNPTNILASHYGISNSVLNLKITSPNTIAGDYVAVPAGFGPEFPSNGTGDKSLILVNDGTGTTNDGCEVISNTVVGNIALIQRGSCRFDLKVKNAQDAGAIAVIIYQNSEDGPFSMGGEDDGINIPSAMISLEEGELIAAENSLINASVKEKISEVLNRFLMQSVNAGASWEILGTNKGLPVNNIGRMELAFGSDGVIYVMVANNDDQTRGLWRSQGIGNNFNKTLSNTKFIERQGWYDLSIAVHPNNSNTVFLGAIDQYKTINAGNTINKNSTWRFDDSVPANIDDISHYMHSDHHGYYFDPINPNHHYIVQDAGVYKTENNGLSFSSLNNGLSISQSYGIAVSPNGKNITSGTQDNGSQIYFGDNNSWLPWNGGDGGYSAWDQQNGSYIYGSNPGTNDDPNFILFGSANGGKNVSYFELPDADGAAFIEPFAIDPNNGNRLIVGTDNVFYTANARSLNNASFTDITNTLASGNVRALTFNQQISSQVLVGMSGGNIYKVNNVGSQNTVVDISPSEEDNIDSITGSITDIKVDSTDSSGNTLYITRATYDSDRVLKSTNGGSSWTSISGNLPDMPLYQVSLDPKDNNRLFVGSELGLWVTNLTDTNPEWARYHYGVAFTRIIDLIWSDDDTLLIGTHGRGTYKAKRNALDISINKFITKNSSNDDDGILDLGESGLLMLNIKNKSGFKIEDAILSYDITELNIDSTTIALETIAANSTVIVPIEVSLADDSSCLNTMNLHSDISYTGGSASKNIDFITAANSSQITTNFIANAEDSVAQMNAITLLGGSAWRRVTTSANSGSFSWFTTNEGNYSDKSITSPWLLMNAGGNNLDFALRYSTEGNASQLWDGVVLEIREQGGLWQDIGHLSTVAYDGQLFTNNSAQTRFAWAGSHNNWRNSRVNLAETYKAKTIQFRFRMVSDRDTGGAGFWVDDIKMSNVVTQTNPTCDDIVSTSSLLPATGLWFDKGRSGHGFVIEPIGRDNLYFTVFYTYDDEGIPEWYTSLATLENGILNINFDAETLQRFTYDFSVDPSMSQTNILDETIVDGRLSIDFNSQSIADNPACQDGTNGRAIELVALAKWKINDQQASWCIEPLVAERNKGNPDIGGTWFAGSDDAGWGFSLALAKSQLISIIFYYDQTGQPRWSIGQQEGFEIGKQTTLQMQEISGFGRLELPIETSSVAAGVLKVNIQNVTGILEIDGGIDLDIEYQGSQAGQWQRTDKPITIFTKPH